MTETREHASNYSQYIVSDAEKKNHFKFDLNRKLKSSLKFEQISCMVTKRQTRKDHSASASYSPYLFSFQP